MMDHWQSIINKTTSYYKKSKTIRKIFMIYLYGLTLVTALKYDNNENSGSYDNYLNNSEV